MKDQRILIEEIVFELGGADPAGRARGLATRAVEHFARSMKELQQTRLRADPEAVGISIARLCVPLDADPRWWPAAGEIADALEREVERQLDAAEG